MDMSIPPKARHTIHQTILNWFKSQPKGSVLDTPAGYGHLGVNLKNMGFDVTCGEINPSIFLAENLKCIYTNLNKEIDAKDESFDYVCCIDGLEHMTDPYQAVKEISRVLKQNGIGIFSIPNYSNIEKRLKFLFHGYLTKPTQFDAYLNSNQQLYDFHNSPITITQLDFMFRINNLKIVDIMNNAKKRKQYILSPLVYILKMVNLFNNHKSKKKHNTKMTLDNRVILGGNNLIFITCKQ